jgi:putative ABC transport system permease protein
LRPDGTESASLGVYAVPAGSTFMDPQVSEGHWLPAEGDNASPVRNAVVINSDVVDKEPDLRPGDEMVLDIGGREAVWQVVGIAPTESRGPTIYVLHDDYAYVTRTPGQVTHVQVITEQHDAAFQDATEERLFQHFENRGLEVSSTKTTRVMQTENKIIFTVVVAFLILMALLLAAVGGLGLTTTMSINVMERVREIGVLRAVGASNASVRQIVLLEGIAIGVLSWGLGMALSLPISRFMSEQLGLALIKVPLSYEYSIVAAVAWFFALLVVAVVASLGPARNAVRLTIREVLAYE